MGKLKGIKKSTKIAIVIGVLLILGAISFRLALGTIIEPFNPADTTKVIITIPMGSGTSQISSLLEENGIIKDADAFKLLSKITGSSGKYKAGTYAFSPSMNAYDIIKILHAGISIGNMITIPEGYAIGQVGDILSKEGFVDKALFMDELENGKFDQKFIEFLPEGPNRLEGYLFPETYEIPIDATEHEIINIMLNQFDALFIDEYYARADELGLSVNDIMTIASMIEREAAVSKDRPLVSSVVYNRIKQGMPLQFCSTVQYILGDQKARLSTEDTQIDSPYNTYINQGLPPGPICSPGIDSIKAALYPADTDYLYFVVDPEGERTHKFSKSYEEFLINKEAYTNSL